MKNRTKYIVLLSILGILLLVWILMVLNPEKTYQIPAVKAPANVTGIEIDKGTGEKIVLAMTNGKWMLEPGDYFANNSDVNDMIEQLKTFAISDLLNGGSLESYGLDTSNRIEIKAYDGTNEEINFFMGKTGATYRHTFVQLLGDTNIYQAKGTFYYAFSKDFNGLKSREITALNKDELLEVRIKEYGNEYVLTKIKSQSTNQTIQWKASWKNSLLDDAKIGAFLQKLTPLSAAGLADGKMDENNPYLRLITLKTTNENVSLYVFKQDNTKEKNYILGVKGNPVLFKITGSQGKDLLKNINEF
jgi:hypothetical protein